MLIIIVGILWGVVGIRIAQSYNQKGQRRNATYAGVVTAIGFIAAVVFSNTHPHHDQALTSDAISSPMNNTDTTVSANAVSNASVNADSSSSTDSITNSDSQGNSEPANKYVPGLNVEDVRLGLQKTWGLNFTMSSAANVAAIYHGEKVDSDTGIKLSCDIYMDSPSQVVQVVFMTDGSGVAGIDSPSDINTLASKFLGYCATAPYDNAQPSAAKDWATNGVAASGDKTRDFSKVQFTLMRTTWTKTLTIGAPTS